MPSIAHLRIGSRLYLGFVTLVLILLATAGFSVWKLSDINASVEKLIAIDGNTNRNLHAAHTIERMLRVALRLQSMQDDSVIGQFNEAKQQTIDAMATNARLTLSDERRKLYDSISAAVVESGRQFDQLAETASKMKQERTKLFKVGDDVKTSLDNLIASTRNLNEPELTGRTSEVAAAVLMVRIANWRFLATNDPKGPATFAANLDKAKAAITALEAVKTASRLQAQITPIKTALTDYAASFDALSTEMLSSEDLFDTALRPRLLSALDLSSQAQTSLDAGMTAQKTEAESAVTNTTTAEEIAAASGAILGAVLAALIGRSITVPLAAMVGAMVKLSGGDKTGEIPSRDRRDEIGEMAQTVEVFKQNMIRAEQLDAQQREEQARKERREKSVDASIAAFEDTVRRSLGSLASASTELRTTAKSMTATAEETSMQATNVAAASEQASANVETAAAATNEMSASIAEINRHVSESAQIAAKAVEEAQRTGGTMQGLSEAAQRIGNVVQLIQDIASQTNLLVARVIQNDG